MEETCFFLILRFHLCSILSSHDGAICFSERVRAATGDTFFEGLHVATT